MSDVIRSSKEIDVIRAWMQTQWERIPATPHSQPGSYARGYDRGMIDILRGLQATLYKLPPAHETCEQRAPVERALARRVYLKSERDMSGYRVVIGFDTLTDVQAAHQEVADIPKAPTQKAGAGE